MLIRLKANIPEIFVGVFLTIAVFGMGMLYASSRHQPAQTQTNQNAAKQGAQHQPDGSLWGWLAALWDWLTHDATGFFTLLLFVAVGIQAGLFIWQLRLIASGAEDAKIAANAAKVSADLARQSLIASQRAWLTAEVTLVEGLKRIIFDTNGAVLPIRIDVKNIGNAPAIKASWHAWINFTQNAVREQALRCNSVRGRPFGIGPTIFPQAQFPDPEQSWSFGAGASGSNLTLGARV